MNYIPLVDTTQLGFIPNVRIRAYRFDNHSVPVPFFDNASGDSPVGYELVSDSEGRISVPGSGVSDSVLLCTHEPAHIVCTDSESGVVRRTFDVSTANIGVVFNDASVKVIVQNHSKLTDGLAQTLQENDYVKVIKDETHGNGISYYYLAEPSPGEYDWFYVGTENDLSNVLDDEIEARQQGDAELSLEIQALDRALTEEEQARAQADLNLQGQIAQKIGDAPNDNVPYVRQNGSWRAYSPTIIFTTDDAETILAAVNTGGELVLAEHIEDGGAYDFKRYAAVSTEVGEGANSYTIKFSRTEGDTIYTKTMTLNTVTPSVSWVSETVVAGSTICPSAIFKTVTDMQSATLAVGDVVETAGFYSVNDGGGAKYQIQATGTANGMDLIAVTGGKIAKLLVLDSAFPDQLGYKRATSSYDVVSYIQRLFEIGVIHIKLHCDRYYLHQRLDLVAGSSIEGIAKRSDNFSGLSRLVFMNNSSPVAITANKYDCRLCNFDLYCSSAHTGDTIGVLTNGSVDSGATQQGCIIDRVKFNGFKTGCRFEGDVNWNLSITGCIFENEDYGVVLDSNKLNVQFDTCYWNHCNKADVIVRKYTSAMAFRSCNFGIYNKAVELQYNRYDWRNFGEVEFSSCNFEVDVNNLQEVTGCFVAVEDYCQASLIFNSCTFNIDKAGSSTSGFAFGNKSRVVFEACHCQEEQYVNYQGELFDSQRPPELSIGSLHIGYGCYGFAKPNYDALHSSCVKFDEDFLVANLKVNPNNLYDKVHTYFTYAGIRKINNVWEFFSEPNVYSGSVVIDIPLYYRNKDLTISMSPTSHNRWIIAATNVHPDIDRTVTPTILSEAYTSSDGRDFASINMAGKRYLTIYYYNLPSDASDEKFYIRDDMMLSLGSYHYPYVSHYTNYSNVKIVDDFVNTPSKAEILAASNGGGVADCNEVIPEQSGTTMFAQVNSFDGTLNLPTGFSGFGLLQASLMINGTRLLQTLFSNNSIYCRRRIFVSGSWTWQAWYKAEMTAV